MRKSRACIRTSRTASFRCVPRFASSKLNSGEANVMRALLTVIAALISTPLAAEEACVKYHKCIPLERFKCEDVARSTFIHRFCYLASERYLIIWLGKDKTAYHYCSIGP